MTAPAENPRPRFGPFVCGTCSGRGGSCGTCRGSGQVWSQIAKLYTPPAAVRADTDDSREPDELDQCIAEQQRDPEFRRAFAAAEARPAVPTDELREQVAEWLFRKVVDRDRLVRAVWPDLPESNRTGWLSWADELLAGPLAPLLAKLRAVEELAESWEALAREYDQAAAAITTPALIDEAQGHAEDIRASIGGLRRALETS